MEILESLQISADIGQPLSNRQNDLVQKEFDLGLVGGNTKFSCPAAVNQRQKRPETQIETCLWKRR